MTGATSSDAPSECAARVSSARRRSVPSIRNPTSLSVRSSTRSTAAGLVARLRLGGLGSPLDLLSLDLAVAHDLVSAFVALSTRSAWIAGLVAALRVAVRRLAILAGWLSPGGAAMRVLSVVGQIEPEPLNTSAAPPESCRVAILPHTGHSSSDAASLILRGARTCVRRGSDTRKSAFDYDLGGRIGSVKLSTPNSAFKGNATAFHVGRCVPHSLRNASAISPTLARARTASTMSSINGVRGASAATYVLLPRAARRARRQRARHRVRDERRARARPDRVRARNSPASRSPAALDRRQTC